MEFRSNVIYNLYVDVAFYFWNDIGDACAQELLCKRSHNYMSVHSTTIRTTLTTITETIKITLTLKSNLFHFESLEEKKQNIYNGLI